MSMSYECRECGLKWPYTKAFALCPGCRTQTVTSTVGEPLTRHQAAFEMFYLKRDKGREGPSPEAIGRAEAEEIIDLERRLGL